MMIESEVEHRQETATIEATNAIQSSPVRTPSTAMARNEDDDIFALMLKTGQSDGEDSSTSDEESCRDHHGNSVSEDCKHELELYKRAQGMKLREMKMFTDPLTWWKLNAHKYPVLARLARIYLPVQPTSAPSERVFSVASRLISSRRTTLDPLMAGRAFFVAENWDEFEQTVHLENIDFSSDDEENES